MRPKFCNSQVHKNDYFVHKWRRKLAYASIHCWLFFCSVVRSMALAWCLGTGRNSKHKKALIMLLSVLVRRPRCLNIEKIYRRKEWDCKVDSYGIHFPAGTFGKWMYNSLRKQPNFLRVFPSQSPVWKAASCNSLKALHGYDINRQSSLYHTGTV